MISVPPQSSPGIHPVAIESPQGRSEPLNFVVKGTAPPATPRIDAVTLANTSFDQDGKVSVILYVQGPNIDVGAKVLVDGVEAASQAHKALLDNSLFGADPAALALPIRHYLSRTVPLASRLRGSRVTVKVVNESGEESEEVAYTLPNDPKTFSSAGDGIADYAKLNGYDNGHGKIDLKALGADPFRRIILVQVDIMDHSTPPIQTRNGKPGTFDVAHDMFAKAPFLNPFSQSGIDLVVDSSGSVPRWNFLAFEDEHDSESRTGSFWKLKAEHFDPRRRGLYHYAIWGIARLDGYSGYSNLDFAGTKVGDSFMITMSKFAGEAQAVQSQAETFVHELGHNLGQKHGGTNNSHYKPNYWSVMSYAWQLRTGQPDEWRKLHPTCTQIYYATPGAVEKNGRLPKPRGFKLDYSEGMARGLVANNNTLDERIGVCGQPVDWNNNGKIDAKPVSWKYRDVDYHDGDHVEDFANWQNLRFDGPQLGGSHNP